MNAKQEHYHRQEQIRKQEEQEQKLIQERKLQYQRDKRLEHKSQQRQRVQRTIMVRKNYNQKLKDQHENAEKNIAKIEEMQEMERDLLLRI